MNKICNKNNFSSWILCLLDFGMTCLFINSLPQKIPINFDMRGNSNEYGSKYFLFVIPALIAFLIIFSEWLRDKLISNVNNRRYYYRTIFFINLFIVVFELCVIAVAKKEEMRVYNNILLVLTGIIIMIIGNMFPKFKHNYLFGIRNRWTTLDEHVWYCTHRFTGKLWFVCGIGLVLAVFTKGMLHSGIVAGITVLLVVTPVLYSKMIYQKQNKRRE